MAIAFICSCGKTLKAKDAFAGRKVKCPQCNSIIRIPRLDGALSDGQEDVPVPFADRGARPPERAVPGLAPAHEFGSSDMLPAIGALAKPAVHSPASELIQNPAAGERLHAWVDRSLMQQPTPWLPGDQERFQKGIKAPREGVSVVELGALGLLVLVGLGAAGWFLVWNK